MHWPVSLRPFGAGYPKPGDPCRRVGESQVTAEYLDDAALLIGCPGTRSSAVVKRFVAANGGSVVAVVDEFALISVPRAKAPGGPTGTVRCARAAGKGLSACRFEITRKRTNAGRMTISWPEGGSRTLFFANGKIGGGDLNQADGSAKHRVLATKELDQYVVTIGEERYEIPLPLIGDD